MLFIGAFVEGDSTAYLIKEEYGDDFYIYKSTDLGDNWIAIDTMVNAFYFSQTISFPTKDTGYISGQFMMYKTVDGGNNWFKQYSSNGVFSNNDFTDWVEDVYCVDALNCFAGGWGRFYRTFNGGDTVLTSIGELNQLRKKLAVYPNPTSGMVNLKTTEKLQSIEVYNLQGQKVQEVNAKERTWQLPEERGLYLIRMQDVKGNVYTERVIKE